MTDGSVFETSEDAVLGGRLRLRQPLRGHRVGHDAILLAAATGGRAGEHAVDLGAGVGAGRPGISGARAGIESHASRDRSSALDLAIGNARLNELDGRVDVLVADAAETGLPSGSADRVLMIHRSTMRPSRTCRLIRAAVWRMRLRPVFCSAGWRRRRDCSSRRVC